MATPKKLIKKELGRLLMEDRIITEEQLDKALQLQQETGMLLGECLVKLQFVNEKDILNCVMIQYGFPYLPLKDYLIDREILKLIPKETALKEKIIPIDKIGNILTLAMNDPLNIKLLQELEEETGLKIEVFISTSEEIKRAIEDNYPKSS